MVDFAGWQLPVQYNDFGIIDSCLHTRSKASLFDVSHMGQLQIFGSDRESFIESLTVGDVKGLKPGESRLSVFTAKDGGIIDDTVITKKTDSVQVVLNAGCVDKDMKHIEAAKANFKGDVHLILNRHFSLLALQGPESARVLQSLISEGLDLSQLPFMSATDATVCGIEKCAISRSGYTGEDGFEISIPTDEGANRIAESLVADEAVRLAGLGARDTLRVEAGLCLYGSDIDESTTPIEAGLGWTVSKRRRVEANFPGASVILDQLKPGGVTRKRVGMTVVNGPPARHDNKIFTLGDTNNAVGTTTSGTFSPSLGKAVCMGYVAPAQSVAGTELLIEVRGKVYPAILTKMPFVKANYYRIQ